MTHEKIKITMSNGHIQNVSLNTAGPTYEYQRDAENKAHPEQTTYSIKSYNSSGMEPKTELDVLYDISSNLDNYKNNYKKLNVALTVTEGKDHKDLNYAQAVEYVNHKVSAIVLEGKNKKALSGLDQKHLDALVVLIDDYRKSDGGLNGDEIAEIKRKAGKEFTIGDLNNKSTAVDIFTADKQHLGFVRANVTGTERSKE